MNGKQPEKHAEQGVSSLSPPQKTAGEKEEGSDNVITL